MPDAAELFQQAIALHRAGKAKEAAGIYRGVLDLSPGDPGVLYLLGMAVYQSEQFSDAASYLMRAVESRPDQAEWQNHLGMALVRSGKKAEGKRRIERAIELAPALAEAQYNLGNLRFSEEEFHAALDCFTRALDNDPGNTHFLTAYCQTLQKLGRSADAIPALRRAIAVTPQDSGLHYAAGCAEIERRNFAAAVKSLEQAVQLAPGWAEAQHNLGKVLFDLGEPCAALHRFSLAAGQQPEVAASMTAVVIPGCGASTNADVLQARRAFADRCLPAAQPGNRFAARARGPRIRIGYISSFFHRQNWMKPVWALLNQHDRSRFEIHLFSDAPLSDIEGGYRAHPDDQYHDISRLNNPEAAAEIESASIDLLIDLNGYSAVRRLALIALRPAPVICAWFNLYATSGIPSYDYLIGDRIVIPSAEEQYYSERIIAIPGSYLTFDVNYETPAVAPPPFSSGAPFSFGCFAPLYKITPECIDNWALILRQAPDASLILRNRAFEWPEAQGRILDRFERAGVPAQRLRLLGPAPHFEFLETYSQADLALDTFPYNGGTTTTEALWQGVPVLTYYGDRWVARTSASLLRAAGLSEFVAPDREAFVRTAVEIATSPDRRRDLAQLRSAMRARLLGSSICQTPRFARRMERIYSEIAPKY